MSDNGDCQGGDERFVVRCRGLPWSCTKDELVEFFAPVEIDPENIHMTTNREGRPSGEAYVQVNTKEDQEEAIKKHRKNMGKRYVEVEYVACKVAVGAGGQKASTLSQLLASSDTSSKTAADFFNVIDVEEDRQARYVEHNAKKNAVRAAKSKARDQVAARVWPTEELWEEFLRDSGKEEVRDIDTNMTPNHMVAMMLGPTFQQKSFPGKYGQLWLQVQKGEEEVSLEHMDQLRLLIKFAFMTQDKKRQAKGDVFWKATELIETEKGVQYEVDRLVKDPKLTDEQMQAKKQELQARLTAENAETMKKREEIASRIWPTTSHWEMFIDRTGIGKERKAKGEPLPTPNVMVGRFLGSYFELTNFTGKYKQIWINAVHKSAAVTVPDMEDLRAKVILACMTQEVKDTLRHQGIVNAQTLLNAVKGIGCPRLYPKIEAKENETEEEKKARYATHQAQKDAEKQFKADAREKMAKRLWPTQAHYDKFLDMTGRGAKKAPPPPNQQVGHLLACTQYIPVWKSIEEAVVKEGSLSLTLMEEVMDTMRAKVIEMAMTKERKDAFKALKMKEFRKVPSLLDLPTPEGMAPPEDKPAISLTKQLQTTYPNLPMNQMTSTSYPNLPMNQMAAGQPMNWSEGKQMGGPMYQMAGSMTPMLGGPFNQVGATMNQSAQVDPMKACMGQFADVARKSAAPAKPLLSIPLTAHSLPSLLDPIPPPGSMGAVDSYEHDDVFESKWSEMEWVVKRNSGNGGPMPGFGGMSGGPTGTDGGENVVRLRGLPFEASKGDIIKFFEGLDITNNGILLTTNYQGRATGEAFVQFANRDHVEEALKKNKESIGHRYIEVFLSSMAEAFRNQGPGGPPGGPGPMGGPSGRGYGMMGPRGGMGGRPGPYDRMGGPMGGMGRGFGPNGPGSRGSRSFKSFGGGGNYGGDFGGRGGGWGGPGGPGGPNYVVRMRGLPFRVTENDIAEWFSSVADPVGIQIMYNNDGRPTGEAEVAFASAQDAKRSLSKDRQNMQHRYVELFYDGPDPDNDNSGGNGGYGGGNGGYGGPGGMMAGGGGGGGGFGGGFGGGNNGDGFGGY